MATMEAKGWVKKTKAELNHTYHLGLLAKEFAGVDVLVGVEPQGGWLLAYAARARFARLRRRSERARATSAFLAWAFHSDCN